MALRWRIQAMGITCEICGTTLDEVIYCPQCAGGYLLEALESLREVLRQLAWNSFGRCRVCNYPGKTRKDYKHEKDCWLGAALGEESDAGE